MSNIPRLRIRVPASTSNLGPGFDFLGLALSLYLDVEVVGLAEGDAPEIEAADGEARGCPQDASNLLVRSMQAVGSPPTPARLHVSSEIPVARGLGSSGAAIAAGLRLGAALSDDGVDEEHMLALAVRLEGHPDNVAASLVGGCTLAVPHAGGVVLVRQEVHASLTVALVWPTTRVSTREARAALPTSVPFADAVENPRRLALLLEGLRRGDPECLRLGCEDKLHVEHRLKLIPGAADSLRAAYEAGAALATVSGSGSALVALARREDCAQIAEAMCTALEATGHGSPITSRVVEVERETPRVEVP